MNLAEQCPPADTGNPWITLIALVSIFILIGWIAWLIALHNRRR